MILLKKPTFRKFQQRMSSNITFLSNKKSKLNINDLNIENSEAILKSGISRDPSYNDKPPVNKRPIVKSISDKNFKIVKEYFDSEKYEIIEEELFRQGEGYCFGEWALIYNQPRSASIYTLEDCVFFTLDEIPFKNSFLRSLNNSEFRKKKFALQNFLPFDMMNERQLSIYKNIIPITCTRNEIIFNEGEKSESIYLIYLGSFTLEKNYGYKKFSVLNLEKGSIVGLESIFEGNKSKYKCSLRLSNGLDIGLIFQLKVNKLKPYIINKMKISFQTNYNLFLKSWRELFKNNLFVRRSISNRKYAQEDIKKSPFFEILEDEKNKIDIYDSNNISILKLRKEDKYETLFKECYESNNNDFDNKKKDGSMRIFSSKQRSKKNNKKDEINNKDNYNIIKYFKEFVKKSEYEIGNLKTTKSLGLRRLQVSYYNDGLYSNLNTKRSQRKYNKKNNNFINKTKTEMSSDRDNNKYYKYTRTDYDLYNYLDRKTPKNKQKIKILKKTKNNIDELMLDKNIIQSPRYDEKKNQDEIILDDINKKYENLKFLLKNKKENIKQLIIKNKLNLKDIIKYNNRPKTNESIIYKLSRQNNSHLSKKNNKFILKISNIPFKNITNIESLSNKSSNHIVKIKNDFPNISSGQGLFTTRNAHKIKLLIKNKKTNKERFFNKNNILKINKINNLNFKIKKGRNILNKARSTNNIFDKKLTDNSTTSNQLDTLPEYYARIFKDFNLNNGFSISHYKKLININNMNNYEIIKQNSKYPYKSNEFKIAFNSGDYNIPLVSSTLKLKGYKVK